MIFDVFRIRPTFLLMIIECMCRYRFLFIYIYIYTIYNIYIYMYVYMYICTYIRYRHFWRARQRNAIAKSTRHHVTSQCFPGFGDRGVFRQHVCVSNFRAAPDSKDTRIEANKQTCQLNIEGEKNSRTTYPRLPNAL